MAPAITAHRASRPARGLWLLAVVCSAALAQEPVLTLDGLPRPATPPPETGAVLPQRVIGWRNEALAYEHGDGVPRDAVRAAELYCRAARYGDADSQYNLAWMLTNARGIERDDATAAHLFAAAAEQGMPQAQHMLETMGTPRGAPPPCLVQPEPAAPKRKGGRTAQTGPWVAADVAAPAPIKNFVKVIAPEYKLAPQLVLAIMATESNFNPFALSPRNAKGLMQLIPGTASRFNVRNPMDPAQNIRGGMAYLRWLLAYFQGDVVLVLAAYNAGEGAVERYRGVPPYAETRNYVQRILATAGVQRHHPYDASVTAPSPQLALMRDAVPIN